MGNDANNKAMHDVMFEKGIAEGRLQERERIEKGIKKLSPWYLKSKKTLGYICSEILKLVGEGKSEK